MTSIDTGKTADVDEEALKRIHSVPYVRGIPEFAFEVRKTFRHLEGEDFILAVDLPHGFESDVLKAVKRLPKPTLILDPLKRGILVIPSCAAIEAVRSFLDQGSEFHFIDASLPVTSSLREWQRVAEYCREFGQDNVFEHAEKYGIDLSSLILQKPEQPVPRPFLHIAHQIGSTCYTELLPPLLSEYFEVRQRIMAMQLRRLLEKDLDIVFVCSQRHWGKVMNFIKEPGVPFDDPIRLPVVPCRLRSGDLAKISPEIPWYIGLYERWRTEGFSRKDALVDLLTAGETNHESGIWSVCNYSMNLALTEAQIYPDLFSIIRAAQMCAGDEYAYSVLERANSYPFDDPESTCRIREFFTWDFESTEQRIITLRQPSVPDWLQQEETGSKKEPLVRLGNFKFSRTEQSRAVEREFMRYLDRRFVARKPVDTWHVEEFRAGLKDGIDCRESLRPHRVPSLYVREQALVNSAAFVVDFGELPTWRAYFDTSYHIVGAARRRDARTHKWVCFTAFLSPPGPMEDLLDDIDLNDPQASCLSLALDYADHVFLFTDMEKRPLFAEKLSPRVRIIDIRIIPRNLREAMRWFHVAS